MNGLISKAEIFDKKRTYSFRGVCMLMIIIHHIILIYGDPYFLKYTVSWGYLGTGMFFLLSGFGLFMSLKKKDSLEFVWLLDKLKKMMFPFFFAFTVYIICSLILEREVSWLQDLTNLLQLRIPNTTSWFLKAIIGLYIITYLTFKIQCTLKTKVVAISITTITFFIFAIFYMSPEWYWSIINFPLGMIIALNTNKLSHNFRGGKIAFCSFITFAIAYRLHLNVICSLTFSILSIVTMTFINPQNKILDYIGSKSINFYLFQMIFLHFGLLFCRNLMIYTIFVLVSTFILSLIYDRIQTLIKI